MNLFLYSVANRFFIVLFVMIISATTTFAQSPNTDDWGEVFGGSQTPKSNNARIAQKPAVVVGAVGQDPKPGLRKALETQIKEAFVKDGRYTAVTREEAVLTAVDNEQAHQRTGAVDDAQVRQIGKQSGAKYVCVVEIAPLMNSYTLSAQFVDIESANIVSMASVTNMLRNPGDFLAASEELVRKLLGYEKTPVTADKKAPVKYVAVIETKIDTQSVVTGEVSNADLMELTTVLRREAVKNLPRDKYNVMTSETVQSMGTAMVEDCAEENCIVTIGSKIGADYVVRGILSKPRGRYSLAVEIFETEYGNLVAVTSEPIRSADFDELIDKTPAGSATMYKSFAGTSQQSATSQPPATISTPTTAVAQGTYTLMVNVNNPEGGNVSYEPYSPNLRYNAGTTVKVTANPNRGYKFKGWSGESDAVTSVNRSESFTMNDNLALTANFDVHHVDDFTAGQRWANFWLNLILPGGGHAIIMKDWAGAIVAWSVIGAGTVSGFSVDWTDTGHVLNASVTIGTYVLWNIIRTTTYHKPGSPKSKKPAKSATLFSRDAFNIAAFPDRNGNWQAAALYMAEF